MKAHPNGSWIFMPIFLSFLDLNGLAWHMLDFICVLIVYYFSDMVSCCFQAPICQTFFTSQKEALILTSITNLFLIQQHIWRKNYYIYIISGGKMILNFFDGYRFSPLLCSFCICVGYSFPFEATTQNDDVYWFYTVVEWEQINHSSLLLFDRKVEEELSNELQLQIQGAEKPTLWNIFAVQFILLPYAVGKVIDLPD